MQATPKQLEEYREKQSTRLLYGQDEYVIAGDLMRAFALPTIRTRKHPATDTEEEWVEFLPWSPPPVENPDTPETPEIEELP